MVFSYYNRLNSAQKRIYRKSDEIHVVNLSNAAELRPFVSGLSAALKDGDRVQTELVCRNLAADMAAGLAAPPLRVRVLAARPSASWGELHGLYVPADGRASAVITVWMRTAQRRRVVAFRSFLRTLLHEFCHHLDYEFFKLEESYHTQGFYKRESSLFHQLVTDDQK
jgi:hypothetical protein